MNRTFLSSPRRYFDRPCLRKSDPPVTSIDGVPVQECRRSEKAVLLTCNDATAWFPLKALECRGESYVIASWLGIADGSNQELFVKNLRNANGR